MLSEDFRHRRFDRPFILENMEKRREPDKRLWIGSGLSLSPEESSARVPQKSSQKVRQKKREKKKQVLTRVLQFYAKSRKYKYKSNGCPHRAARTFSVQEGPTSKKQEVWEQQQQ
jgi:hypothetical protein